MSKTNGKKRTVPSVERQLALALVAVLEAVETDERLATPPQNTDSIDNPVFNARAILKTHGYDDLESIPTRVKRIEAEIAEALTAQDGAKLAQLGAALDRAKKGLPPLPTEKKARAPRKAKTEPASRKPRQKKLGEGVATVCPSCKWTGNEVPGSACPDCGAALATEGEAK